MVDRSKGKTEDAAPAPVDGSASAWKAVRRLSSVEGWLSTRAAIFSPVEESQGILTRRLWALPRGCTLPGANFGLNGCAPVFRCCILRRTTCGGPVARGWPP